MKAFIWSSFLFGLVVFANSLATKEVSDLIRSTAEKCQNGNYNMVDVIKTRKLPSNNDEKCVLACFFEGMKVMKEEKFDIEAFKHVNSQKYDDKNVYEQVVNIDDYCIKEVETLGIIPDKCELSHKLVDCIFKEMDKMAIPPPELS